MAFAVHGEMLVAVHNESPPTQSRWEEFCRECHRLYGAGRRHAEGGLMFVVSDGGGPNVLQRAQLLKALERSPIRTAVVSPSLGVWRIHAALHLFNSQGSCFDVQELRLALVHLGIGPRRFGELARVLEDVSQSVPRAYTARTLYETLLDEQQRQQLKTDSGIRGRHGMARKSWLERLKRGA